VKQGFLFGRRAIQNLIGSVNTTHQHSDTAPNILIRQANRPIHFQGLRIRMLDPNLKVA